MSEMETQSQMESKRQFQMLPPEPGTFQDREELIKYVRDFGATQGYVVTIKKSRKDRRVILGCDRGGVYRNRRKIEESQRKRKACSRLINCPFEVIGKKENEVWFLSLKNGAHNHEPLKDMSEHPYSRRFSEDEVRQIKMMTEAGAKPRQVLEALKQSNPELQSTPRNLYNLKAKIRQGSLSDKSFKSWRPSGSIPVNTNTIPAGGSPNQNNQPLHLKVSNFIGGKFMESQGTSIINVINPASQNVVSQVPLTTYEEFKDAVIAAKKAFPLWKSTPIGTRQQIMFKLRELIHRDMDKLAMSITSEQGKPLKGAQHDVLYALEMVEHACGIATLQMQDFFPNVSNGIDAYYIREPLGICAGICPFDFPATVPLWMFPIAVTCGNTFILKPCEKTPGISMILAALVMEAGLPDGVLNIVHGTNDVAKYICDDDDIKAISFISSEMTGIHIEAGAVARGKRIQSNVGGTNHAIIMPDANMVDTLNTLVGAGFGAAGQRYMALSTAVFVGGSLAWEHKLVECAKALKVNAGTDPSADIGPVINKEVKDCISRLVQSGIDSGARLLLDGRNVVVSGYEDGNFVGPTILCDVTTNMDCCKEEIFGPVLLCMQANSLEEAINIVNRNRYRSGASIFTSSGAAARKFQNDIDARLVGVNVHVPVPTPFLSSNEPKASFAGDLNFCGKAGVQFYTQIKTVAQQWRGLRTIGVSSSMVASFDSGATRGVSSVPLLQGDSSKDIATQDTSLASDGDSPKHTELPQEDFTTSGVSTVPEIVDEDIPSQGVPLALPPTAEQDFLDREKSLAVPPLAERGLLCQETQTYKWNENPSVTPLVLSPTAEQDFLDPEKSLAIPPVAERGLLCQETQMSKWNGNPPLTTSTSQRIFMSMFQRNGNVSSSSKSSDTAIALISDGYFSSFHKSDNVGPLLLGNDCTTPTSHMTDASVLHPASRLYDIFAASHLKNSLGQTFQRDKTMFPTCKRRYVVDQIDHMGSSSTSERPDISSRQTSDTSCVSTKHRDSSF